MMRKKNNRSGDAGIMSDINTTPLIDVMLVLLIMFIITIPVQLHSVKMNMPVASNVPPSQPPVVVKINLDDQGGILWDGSPVSAGPALDRMMLQLAEMPDQPEVHLKPTKLTEYRFVAAVMASAQRIGVTKIGIVGNERFVP
jgi:biopolymer transport protein ExbD